MDDPSYRRDSSLVSSSRPLLRAAALVAASVACALPPSLTAQSWTVGGGFILTVPKGDFDVVTDEGYGFSVQSVFKPDPWGVFGLRLDGTYITYGSESFFVPISPTVPRITGELTTRNNIAMFSVGPQLAVPSGPIRPYVNGFVGMGYFFTQSSIRGSDGPCCHDFASSTNFDDWSFAYGGGGGMAITLTRDRRLQLLLEAQYRHHETTQYLREGSITEDRFGNLFIDVFESDVDMVMLQLGVAYAF